MWWPRSGLSRSTAWTAIRARPSFAAAVAWNFTGPDEPNLGEARAIEQEGRYHASARRAGDRMASGRPRHLDCDGTRRPQERHSQVGCERPRGFTEERNIIAIDGLTLTLDQSLDQNHEVRGDYGGEVANLSRNVVIESANPERSRGHTMYHRGSKGSISYTEFRHLGKEGVLGKYSLHFHRVGDSMRGSSVVGASICDSGNRWITIHGTSYLVVRDCVGYRSVGHGFYLEDGSETYNVLDRNLAVQAFAGKVLPGQFLEFDRNDGAGFWWANSLNSFMRNVAVECDRYGYRYEATPRENAAGPAGAQRGRAARGGRYPNASVCAIPGKRSSFPALRHKSGRRSRRSGA